MLNIGHRGAMGYAPENTLPSFEKALQMGVDWIELDVYAVEGELVVIHDDTLERTTNGSGRVMDQSLAYLRSLDAGHGARIPLLAEVFELVNQQVGINVELKGPDTAVPTIRFLEDQLKKGWPLNKILISSFDHAQLLTAKAENPQFERAALYYNRPIDYNFVTETLAAAAVNPWLGDVTAHLVNQAHQYDLQVYVFTVNDPADIRQMRKLGVDGVFTNYPDRV